MVLRTVNAVCGKRKIGKTIIIGYTTNLTVDINRFRKKYKRVVLKDKDYRPINGLIPGQRLLYRYETCFSHRIPLFKAVGFSCLSRISLI